MNIIKKASAQLASSIPKRDKEQTKCFYCKGDINDDTDYYQEDLANDTNYYHTQCLTCHQCKKNCSAEFYFTFKKINNYYLPTIYCRKDMNPTCFLCGTSIERGGLVTFLGNKYHESHFKCVVCQEILSMDTEVFEIKKKLYCLKHFVKEYKKEQEYQKKFMSKKKYQQSIGSNSNSVLISGSKLSLTEEEEEVREDNNAISATNNFNNHIIDEENSLKDDKNNLSHSNSLKNHNHYLHNRYQNPKTLQHKDSLSRKQSNAADKAAAIMNHTIGSPPMGQNSSTTSTIMGSLGSASITGNVSFDDFYDEDDDEDDEEDFIEIEGLAKYRNENLDVRDFSNNDYSTKYCGGCKTMLLAGTNIKEIRFRDKSTSNITANSGSSTSAEFWHLDCFVLFVRYKVIFSPQFIDPRRYRIFNSDASSMNMNNDLRNISSAISLLFEKIETCFANIMKCVECHNSNKRKVFASKKSVPKNQTNEKSEGNDIDECKTQQEEELDNQFLSLLSIAIYQLLSKMDILFKVLEDVLFLIDDDQYNAIQNYQLPKDTPLNNLEKINFNSKYNLMKNTHLKLYDAFKEFLSSDIQEYDIVFFNHQFTGILNYIIKFMLHKTLMFNYLNKQNMTMTAFFHNLKQRLLDDDQIDQSSIDDNWLCAKCHEPIHLESYVLKIDADSINEGSTYMIRKSKLHTNCVQLRDMEDTHLGICESYVADIQANDTSSKEERNADVEDNTIDHRISVEDMVSVSIYDCVINEIKFLIEKEMAKKSNSMRSTHSPF